MTRASLREWWGWCWALVPLAFTVVVLMAVVGFAVVSAEHALAECRAKHCDHGAPLLLNGECVCVERAR